MSEGHSNLGGSGAYRWLMCPGSVNMCADIESKSSSYAMEGTAAHNLAEECINRKVSPYSYINGGTITVEEDDGNQIEIEVTPDMAAAVMTYIQHVMGICKANGSVPEVETDFHMDHIDDELWGRNDFKTFVPFDTLYVYDYKHGAGVGVEVQYPTPQTYFAGGKSDKNPQLMYYALGALGETNEHFIQDVEVGIVQPRKPHADGSIRSVRVPLSEVYYWRDSVLIPGIAATREENAPCVGGSWCQFCDAIGVCPAVFDKVSAVTKQTASEVFKPKEIKFPAFADMTDEMKAAFVEYKTLMDKWMKGIKSEIDKEILGGAKNPGLKVVNSRASNDWISEHQAGLAAIEALPKDEVYTKPKIKTVAQMREALKAHGLAEDKLDEYVTTTRGKAVVPVGDKRKEISIETAAEVFCTGGVDTPEIRWQDALDN